VAAPRDATQDRPGSHRRLTATSEGRSDLRSAGRRAAPAAHRRFRVGR
jgi:hypothetical protein